LKLLPANLRNYSQLRGRTMEVMMKFIRHDRQYTVIFTFTICNENIETWEANFYIQHIALSARAAAA